MKFLTKTNGSMKMRYNMKNKKNSKKNKTFTRDFWLCLLVFIALIGAICYLPTYFTESERYNFNKDTGIIGDTIGGIMGPFVAIAAAILTFLAFWVQFKANEQLRNDISVERFESKFYKLLDIHMQNVNSIKIDDKKGRDAFKYLTGIYFYMYDIIQKIYKDNSHVDNPTNEQREMLTRMTYGFFFYGEKFVYHSFTSTEENYLYEEIKKKLSIINSSISYNIIDGYNTYLGHYYRNLFQIVDFVANYNENLIDEKQKYGYVKMVRAQLSDYEQIMLYYNSISDAGKKWNTIKDSKSNLPQAKMGYIARFKLIKNIPFDSLIGLWPNLKYKDEINVYQSLGERFFEHNFIKCTL